MRRCQVAFAAKFVSIGCGRARRRVSRSRRVLSWLMRRRVNTGAIIGIAVVAAAIEKNAHRNIIVAREASWRRAGSNETLDIGWQSKRRISRPVNVNIGGGEALRRR